MLYTSPSQARSSSAYSVRLPNMSQLINQSSFTPNFQFNSPIRSYLKTNEIKQRKLQHHSIVAKLTDIINNQHPKKIPRKSLQSVNRRTSAYCITDKTQILWESLKIKFEHETSDQLYELLLELLKQSNHLQVEKYTLPIQTKQEFTRFKHNFILTFLMEPNLLKIIYKLEQFRQPLLNPPSLYQELRGYSTISQIVDLLYIQLLKDITLQPFVIPYLEKDFKQFAIQLITNLIQSQGNSTELRIQLHQFSEQHKLNHVHFTNFKILFYKILIQFSISERAIRKILKIIDSYKSSILRAKPIKNYLIENSDLLPLMVIDNKNQEQQKKQIMLLLEYITNNHSRTIKKDDLLMLNINQNVCQSIVSTIQSLKPNHLIMQDFTQDLKSCLSQNYTIPSRLLDKLAKKLNQVPFYATIYKEHSIDWRKLIKIEIDFISQNRTHFRKKEIQLIHKRFKITNEIFDSYIQNIQDIMGVYSQNLVSRINHYRDWIVTEKNIQT
ncbi:unnamed protein product [Paramecium primaurelia]|uniref:Uncharacterized protein n=1 Tax=Paramecium primaurelia TaxID=5886 RepID=A0A8S1M919_PARPR|nr:unnamed protein product [Paramecium primaurelia]